MKKKYLFILLIAIILLCLFGLSHTVHAILSYNLALDHDIYVAVGETKTVTVKLYEDGDLVTGVVSLANKWVGSPGIADVDFTPNQFVDGKLILVIRGVSVGTTEAGLGVSFFSGHDYYEDFCLIHVVDNEPTKPIVTDSPSPSPRPQPKVRAIRFVVLMSQCRIVDIDGIPIESPDVHEGEVYNAGYTRTINGKLHVYIWSDNLRTSGYIPVANVKFIENQTKVTNPILVGVGERQVVARARAFNRAEEVYSANQDDLLRIIGTLSYTREVWLYAENEKGDVGFIRTEELYPIVERHSSMKNTPNRYENNLITSRAVELRNYESGKNNFKTVSSFQDLIDNFNRADRFISLAFEVGTNSENNTMAVEKVSIHVTMPTGTIYEQYDTGFRKPTLIDNKYIFKSGLYYTIMFSDMNDDLVNGSYKFDVLFNNRLFETYSQTLK